MEKGRLWQGMAGKVTVLVITEDWGSETLQEGGRRGAGGNEKAEGGREEKDTYIPTCYVMVCLSHTFSTGLCRC